MAVTLAMMQQFQAELNTRFTTLREQTQAQLAAAIAAIDQAVGSRFEEANKAFAEERGRITEQFRVERAGIETSAAVTAESVRSLSTMDVAAVTEQTTGINQREETFKEFLSTLHRSTVTENEQRFLQLDYR